MKTFKNFWKNIVSFSLLLCIAMFSSAFLFNGNFNQSKAETYASEHESIDKTYTMFIKSPTFSTYFNEKIYFIDDSDNILKIYDVNKKICLKENVDLSMFNDIIDASYVDGSMFVLVSNNEGQSLVAINLTSLEKTVIKTAEFNNGFKKISSTKINDGGFEKYVISLVPVILDESTPPCVAFLKKQTLELESIHEITIGDAFETLKQSLTKFFVIDSISNKINIIFFYGTKVSFATLSLEALQNSEALTAINEISTQLENTASTIKISNINMMNIDSKDYFLISYVEEDIEREIINFNSSFLYAFFIDDSTNSYFKCVTTSTNPTSNTRAFINENSNFLLTSNNIAIFPTENQSISFCEVSVDNSGYMIPPTSKSIAKNPEIIIREYEPDNFVYMTTTKDCVLQDTPWSPTGKLAIDSGYDVICIGDGMIKTIDTSVPDAEYETKYIADYKFCLFTTNDGENSKNVTGYVKSSYIKEKDKINIDEYDCPEYFKVVPNTKLYTLPTKVTGQIIPNKPESILFSKATKINENYRIRLVDAICSYKSQQSIMLKVDYNGKEGYIEKSNIIFPSEQVDYIITNSSIKNDDTVVYIDLETKETLNFKLNKGYRVKITGKRDTKTGYTAISFNDEYGNEFSGYIATDIISTDSWSTLQIVGSVLIAINIGLLILILKFRKQKIGSNGQKYTDSKKPNYKKKETETSTIVDE